jgi:hypothetical protein
MKQSLFLLVSILLAGCSQRTTLVSPAYHDRVAMEVRETLTDYLDAVRAHGFMGEINYLDDSDDFFWVPPGRTSAIGYDSVIVILRASAPLYQVVDNRWDSLQVVPITKHVATYTGKLTSELTDMHGKTETYHLLETGVVIRRRDGWKLLHGHTSLME